MTKFGEPSADPEDRPAAKTPASDRALRMQANQAKAEQRRIDGERARADYQALNDAQNANMERLRALRLARDEQFRRNTEAAAETPPAVKRAKPAGRRPASGAAAKRT